MLQSVSLPLWLLILILGFAAVTFASHFLFPSVRWFVRRRAERVVGELNKRLERPIQPFKLLRRYDTIQRVIYDPEVLHAVTEHAAEEGIPESVAFERTKRYAREIVPRFSPASYFGFATRAARWLSRSLYDVEVDEGDPAAFAAIDRDATLIFVMNHRSNMDYVLVTYLVATRSALSYAVGEWARVWPLSSLIRSMGAFFIRRRSRNALYRRVLAAYVRQATAAGVTQAIFPEGGLSQDGRVGAAKLGLLSYILDGYDANSGRDVVFVPVALNYDRVLEDRVLLDAAQGGTRRFRASIPQALGFGLRFFVRKILRRGMRFGRAAVSFGAPMPLSALMKEGVTSPKDVGARLMEGIRDEVPVLPVPLVAHALCEAGGAQTEDEIGAQISGYLAITSNEGKALAADGLRTLLTRRILKEQAGRYAPLPGEMPILKYYSASIAQRIGSAEPPET